MQGKLNVSQSDFDERNSKRKYLKGQKLSEWDRENIRFLVEWYRKAFPGVIEEVARQGRKETIPMTGPQLKKAMAQPLGVRRIAIPVGLWHRIQEGYPAIMVDAGQFNQFLKWFPEFDLLKR